MPPSYTLSHLAYLKLVLHAAKYPHATVNGVLLTSSAPSSKTVLISDAVPLLHHWTTLSPMMEIGLDLAGTHADDNNARLVGYYEASDRTSDTSLSSTGERVYAKLTTSNPDAVALMFNAESFATGQAGLVPFLATPTLHAVLQPPPFPLLVETEESPDSKSSTKAPLFLLESTGSPSKASDAIRKRHLHREFGDFDDHLEDVTIDWLRNPAIQ